MKTDSKYNAINNGEINIKGSTKKVSANHEVSGITKGSIVEKYSYTNGSDEKESIVGYDKDKNVFVYKVVLNGDFAYGDGDRFSFKDTLPEGTELDTEYLKPEMLPGGKGEIKDHPGIYFVTYYGQNGKQDTPDIGVSNFISSKVLLLFGDKTFVTQEFPSRSARANL